ncbi:MAG: hypothetical protein KH321_01155 [Clostridium sp.]|nr:hypothetical protein [Clostridium sp.]
MLKVGLNSFQKIGSYITKHADSAVGNAFAKDVKQTVSADVKSGSQITTDTFQKAGGSTGSKVTKPISAVVSPKLTFEDVYKIAKLGNGRIKIIPKNPGMQINGKNLTSIEMPEYLYHITSESNMKLIQSTNTLKRSTNEQLQGVYLFDKQNFLSNYTNVKSAGKQYDLCSSLLQHANAGNKNSTNLVLIKILTESLLKNGNLRFRRQEDFFYYQDMVIKLQKDLKQKFSLRLLSDDKNRAQFEKYVLDNKILSKAQLDKFMKDMKDAIHYGYTMDKLGQFEKNSAVEFIFNKDISPDVIKGIKCRKFDLKNYMNLSPSNIDLQKLKDVFA